MFDDFDEWVNDFHIRHYNDERIGWLEDGLVPLILSTVCKFKHREEAVYQALKARHPEDDKVMLAIVELEKICPKCECPNEIETLTLVENNDYSSNTISDL